MAQLDKELFFEYTFWLFLTLIHFYSSFFVNKTMVHLNSRKFLLNHFYFQYKFLNEQQKRVIFALENLFK